MNFGAKFPKHVKIFLFKLITFLLIELSHSSVNKSKNLRLRTFYIPHSNTPGAFKVRPAEIFVKNIYTHFETVG